MTENAHEIFDGLESHSPNITDKLCRSLPPPIESNGHQMMILFETDYQSGEKGFSATYTSNENSVCGGLVSIPATASADIKSPDYPSDYPPSTECKWLVDSHQTYNTTFKVTGLNGAIALKESDPKWTVQKGESGWSLKWTVARKCEVVQKWTVF